MGKENWLNVLNTLDKHLEEHPNAMVIKRSMSRLGGTYVPRHSTPREITYINYSLAPTKPLLKGVLKLWRLNGLLHSLVPDELSEITFPRFRGRIYQEPGESFRRETRSFKYEVKKEKGKNIKLMSIGRVWFAGVDIGDVVMKRKAEQRAIINTESIQDNKHLQSLISDFCEPTYCLEDDGKGILKMRINLVLYPCKKFGEDVLSGEVPYKWQVPVDFLAENYMK